MLTITTHRENIITNYLEAVRLYSDEYNKALSHAYARVSIDWLGYENDEEFFIDGAEDRGLDYWFPTNDGFDIFQIKSIDSLDNDKVTNKNFDKDCLHDIHRIYNFLVDSEGITGKNTKLKLFKERWSHLLSSKRLASDEESSVIIININLIVIGSGLTDSALEEFNAIQRNYSKPFSYDNTEIHFLINLITLDNIVENKWREDNRDWKDMNGRKTNKIELMAEKSGIITTPNSSIFYTPAIDLVNAYKKFGYQIFEPNVRCNIKKSKVNAAIKKSILHRASRREFRYLNNGVTLICQNYSKPNVNKDYFTITEPGIVNGLQTVISVTETYDNLNQSEKMDFEDNCYIMVRLLTTKAVKDVNLVVTATNNQNTMEPRNLKSNSPEQIVYEKLFSELGWFYSRKQGSWEAFIADPKRWRTLPDSKKADFTVKASNNKIRYKKVDNEDLAQTWMAFVGFSNIAVHEKSKLFDRDAYYEFIFLSRPTKLAYDSNYQFAKIKETTINQAPDPSLMLLAYLIRQFAKSVTLSAKENYNQAILRQKIDTSQKTREEVVSILSKNDGEYRLGVALTGMSFTFVEFVGYVLYKSLGEDLFKSGRKILNNGSLKILFEEADSEKYKNKIIVEDFDKNDVIAILWHAFRHVINELLNGTWGDSYRSSSNKSRFIAEENTRRIIADKIDRTNHFTTKSQLTELWAAGIKDGEGLYGLIKRILN